MKSRIFILFCSIAIGSLSAQQISWTGSIDKISLFASGNWIDEATNQPFVGNIASSLPINRDIYFGANAVIGTDKEVKGIFDAGSGKIKLKKAHIRTDYAGVTGFKSATSITLDSSIVLTGNVSSPAVVLSGNSQLHLYESDAISTNTKINILGEDAWVYIHSLSPQQVIDKYIKQISVDGVAAIAGSNVRITQYYDGAVVIPHRSSIKALLIYSGANQTGISKYFRVSYSNSKILGNIGANNTNKAASFFLKKGYMATFIEKQDGTGACKMYIAEDSDIVVSGKINGKNDTVNIVRVAPWRWISKKGTGGNFTEFSPSWYYNWGAGSSSTVDKEFVPMQWGTWNLDVYSESLKTQPDVTHVLAYNEPDGKEQANMTYDQMLTYWPKLMLTGLRLGSPAFVRTDSLIKFMDKAIAKGYRVDYMCFHSYEKRTGDNYVNTIYKPLYDKYKIPIWVTEFNYGASWNVTANESLISLYNGQKDFITKMNAAPFVERFAVFAWSNPLNMVDTLVGSFEKYVGQNAPEKSILSARGIYYREFESMPSRGNPLIYRTKISKAKQDLAASLPTTVEYDSNYFSFVSRNTDGTNRRRIQISATAGKVNTAFIGGASTVSASTNEVFLMTKTSGNIYKLKVNSNSLTLSVRNDSVVVEAENQSSNQLWEMVAMTGTNYFALKNIASGKYINPFGNSITAGTLLTMLSSADITQNKSAYWEPVAGIDPTLGVFDMKVVPLTGVAPLTVKMTGSKLTKENKDAFYRWYNFQGTDTIFSTEYTNEYTYTKPGIYRIQVRGRDYVSRNTTKEFTITVNDPLGIANLTTSPLRIYPNPVGATFQLKGIAEGKEISLYDAQGRLALKRIYTGKSIETNQLPAGFYVLKCEGYAPLKLMKK